LAFNFCSNNTPDTFATTIILSNLQLKRDAPTILIAWTLGLLTAPLSTFISFEYAVACSGWEVHFSLPDGIFLTLENIFDKKNLVYSYPGKKGR
jgi:hypothetical protein